MSGTIACAGPTRALRELYHAFEFGESAESPGVIDATHAATWHVAGMIEQLRSLREAQVEALKRGQSSAGPVHPDEEPGAVLHDFQWGDDDSQHCTRCTLPRSQWAGDACPRPNQEPTT